MTNEFMKKETRGYVLAPRSLRSPFDPGLATNVAWPWRRRKGLHVQHSSRDARRLGGAGDRPRKWILVGSWASMAPRQRNKHRNVPRDVATARGAAEGFRRKRDGKARTNLAFVGVSTCPFWIKGGRSSEPSRF